MGKVEKFRIGDKDHKITIRLNEKIYNYVKENAERVGSYPSEFIRMVLTSAYYSNEEAKAEDEDI